MRAIFFVFSLSVLVLAAPVIKGDVKLVRNRYLKPETSHSRSCRQYRHPCVVLSDADDHGEVKVATLSHNHLQGVKTKPANDYAPFEKHPVLGEGLIDVGPPRRVHISKLKEPTLEPKIVEPDKLQKLIKDINKNCSPDQQLTGVCSSPEHSSPEHSSPEHGRPVHGSPDHGRPESSSDSGWQTMTRKVGDLNLNPAKKGMK